MNHERVRVVLSDNTKDIWHINYAWYRGYHNTKVYKPTPQFRKILAGVKAWSLLESEVK